MDNRQVTFFRLVPVTPTHFSSSFCCFSLFLFFPLTVRFGTAWCCCEKKNISSYCRWTRTTWARRAPTTKRTMMTNKTLRWECCTYHVCSGYFSYVCGYFQTGLSYSKAGVAELEDFTSDFHCAVSFPLVELHRIVLTHTPKLYRRDGVEKILYRKRGSNSQIYDRMSFDWGYFETTGTT